MAMLQFTVVVDHERGEEGGTEVQWMIRSGPKDVRGGV
jgi:hypothetical protein